MWILSPQDQGKYITEALAEIIKNMDRSFIMSAPSKDLKSKLYSAAPRLH